MSARYLGPLLKVSIVDALEMLEVEGIQTGAVMFQRQIYAIDPAAGRYPRHFRRVRQIILRLTPPEDEDDTESLFARQMTRYDIRRSLVERRDPLTHPGPAEAPSMQGTGYGATANPPLTQISAHVHTMSAQESNLARVISEQDPIRIERPDGLVPARLQVTGSRNGIPGSGVAFRF